jgi:drug/metabolite transporter (DMT)-like permease
VRKTDALKLILVSFLWGGQFVAARVVTTEAPPFAASFLRFVFAAVALLILHMVRERRFLRLTFRQWTWFTLLGVSGVFLCNLFSALAIPAVVEGGLVISGVFLTSRS